MTLAASMAACAFLTSMTIEVNGQYDRLALALLTAGVIAGLIAVALHAGPRAGAFLTRHLATILAGAALISAGVLLYTTITPTTRSRSPLARGVSLSARPVLSHQAIHRAGRAPVLVVVAIAPPFIAWESARIYPRSCAVPARETRRGQLRETESRVDLCIRQ
jgi:hypothetical protein